MTILAGLALVLMGGIIGYIFTCGVFDHAHKIYTERGIMEYRGDIYTVKKLFEEPEI